MVEEIDLSGGDRFDAGCCCCPVQQCQVPMLPGQLQVGASEKKQQQRCYTSVPPTSVLSSQMHPKFNKPQSGSACLHTPVGCAHLSTATSLCHTGRSFMQRSALKRPGWGCLLDLDVCAALQNQAAPLRPLLPVKPSF